MAGMNAFASAGVQMKNTAVCVFGMDRQWNGQADRVRAALLSLVVWCHSLKICCEAADLLPGNSVHYCCHHSACNESKQ